VKGPVRINRSHSARGERARAHDFDL